MDSLYLAEEPFWSIQGEGLRTGEPTIFIRLAGCNVQPHFWCSEWCDTKWARNNGFRAPVEDIVKIVEKLPKTEWIDITGGEPLVQNLIPLVNILCKNYMIQIETNGTIAPPRGLYPDHWTVSPKTPDVQEIFWGIAKEFKWVIQREEDLERVKIKHSYWGKTFLQPVDNDPRAIEVCLKALENYPTWRLGLQIHKIVGVR